MIKILAKQQKKLSSSVKIKYLNGPEIIKALRSTAKKISKKMITSRVSTFLALWLEGFMPREVMLIY